jgi:hypothetical protein
MCQRLFMVDFGKILRRERHLKAISKCCDEMAAIRKAAKETPQRNALLNTLGQMDWADEIHRLLYEEADQLA